MSGPDPFAAALGALTADGSHRVWSLIVTLFGDLAQGKGDEVTGAVLARILDPVGVRAEALRVALHRLRKDGWIESRRDGRTSAYFLTDHGRRASAAASARIYARTAEDPGVWHVLIAGSAEQARALQMEDVVTSGAYLPVGDRALMGPGPAPDLPGALSLTSATPGIPPWLKAQILPDDVAGAYRRACRTLETVDTALAGWSATPLQAATLRVLIVHTWRRIVLRHPDAPDRFLPEAAPVSRCRDQVMGLLDRFERPALDALRALA